MPVGGGKTDGKKKRSRKKNKTKSKQRTIEKPVSKNSSLYFFLHKIFLGNSIRISLIS